MSNLTDIIDRPKTDPRHEKSLARLRAFCKDDHGQDIACIPPDGLDAANQAIIQHFAAQGWKVTPKHDQRDGDWLEFMPAG